MRYYEKFSSLNVWSDANGGFYGILGLGKFWEYAEEATTDYAWLQSSSILWQLDHAQIYPTVDLIMGFNRTSYDGLTTDREKLWANPTSIVSFGTNYFTLGDVLGRFDMVSYSDLKNTYKYVEDSVPFFESWKGQAWSMEYSQFSLSTITTRQGGVIYLDSMSPFIELDLDTYADLINDLQIDKGYFWQCQNYPTTSNVGFPSGYDWK